MISSPMRNPTRLLLLAMLVAYGALNAQIPPNYSVEINEPGAYEGDLYFAIIGPPLKPVNIASPSGELLFSEVWPQEGYDWKVNDDGLHTLFHRGISAWITRDPLMQPIDTTFFQNGFNADMHDYIRTPEGHQVMIAYHWQSVDMSEYLNGGDPNALLEVAIIQELNPQGEVIFEWNALDHMSPLDLENALLTSPEIVFNHANSIDIDTDGHFILSSRNLNEVTKIHRQTGEILWRLGAGAANEFTFVDSYPFTFQHSARPLGENHYLLFDNGNFSSMFTDLPNQSRAVEFELDTVNMTASAIWEYMHPDNLFGPAMGSVQRLPNENTLINWGTQSSLEHGGILTEVTSDGIPVLELVFVSNENIYSASKSTTAWEAPIPGCMDSAACNFDPAANIEPDPIEPAIACYFAEEGYDCDGLCLEDIDLDEVCDANDNCPTTSNPDQFDSDQDGIGDACDDTTNGILNLEIPVDGKQLIGTYNSIGQALSPSERLNYPGLIISIYSDGSMVKRWNPFR